MTDVLEHSDDSSSEELLVDTKDTERLLKENEQEKNNSSKSTLSEACINEGLLGTQTAQGINNPPIRVKHVTFNSASSLSTRRKFTIGLIIVAVIATSWVGSTQTAKSSLSGKFLAPFFLMWFGTAWMMAVFPLTAPIYFLTGRGKFNRQGVRELWRYNTECMQSYVQCITLFPPSLVPRPCAFVACSTKFAQRAWARSSRDVCRSDERAGPGNEATSPLCGDLGLG